jgi:hypothetical protein
VIYRELFPSGLTLLDKGHLGDLGTSHLVARQELRTLVAGSTCLLRVPSVTPTPFRRGDRAMIKLILLLALASWACRQWTGLGRGCIGNA